MEGWGLVIQDQGTWGHPVWLLICGCLLQCQPQGVGTGLGVSAPVLYGSLAQGWHLYPAQPWPQERLKGHSLPPVFQPKAWGYARGMPNPLAPLYPPLFPCGPPGAWHGWVGAYRDGC